MKWRKKRRPQVKGVLISVLVFVQIPKPVAHTGSFPDLCSFASSLDPRRPCSPSRLSCVISVLYLVHFSFSSEPRPPLSFPHFDHPSFLTVSIISVLSPSASLPLTDLSSVWSAGRKSSGLFTFCGDTCTPASLRAHTCANITGLVH